MYLLFNNPLFISISVRICHVYLFMSTHYVQLTANSIFAISPFMSAETPVQSWDTSVSGNATAVVGNSANQRIKNSGNVLK